MMYTHLPDGKHQLSITGPEFADIADLVVSLAELGGDARLISFKLFDDLHLQGVVDTVIGNPDGMEMALERVYNRASDGTFQIIFPDYKYCAIANLLLDAFESGDNAESAARKLFNALGFQEAFKSFMSSAEGRDIFMRTSPEEGHA